MKINTVEDLDNALAHGPYSSIGSYPIYFICRDGEALSYKTVKENYNLVKKALENKNNESGWQVIACDVNWQNKNLIDADSGERIEYAYGNEE